MKILILNSDYPAFIESVVKNNKDWSSLSYNERAKFYFSQFFGTADYYSKNLNLLGHEAQDVVINNHYLQKQWLKERNIIYCHLLDYFDNNKILRTVKRKLYISNDWYYRAMLAQIKEYKPDVVYVQLMAHISPVFLRKIKKHCKLLVGQIACPLPAMSNFKEYDLILSSLPNFVEKFKAVGIKSEYFKLGFEEEILNHLNKRENSFPVVHIGGYGQVHQERNILLESANEVTPIDFFGYGFSELAPESKIRNNFHGEAWGLEMFNILYNSKITMTKHIQAVANDYANNMTLYEATGVGTLLITDEKKNLGDIFKVGEEVVTYKDADDLAGKIKYYLEHEEERKLIAAAGQKRTLETHNYKVRMKELLIILNKYL